MVSRLGKPYSPPQVKPLDRWVYPYAEGHLSKNVNGHVTESTWRTKNTFVNDGTFIPPRRARRARQHMVCHFAAPVCSLAARGVIVSYPPASPLSRADPADVRVQRAV